MAAKWSKLIVNTSNALYALDRPSHDRGLNAPEVQHFVADVWDEGLDVLNHAGRAVGSCRAILHFARSLRRCAGRPYPTIRSWGSTLPPGTGPGPWPTRYSCVT